jgi:hypothetical protein
MPQLDRRKLAHPQPDRPTQAAISLGSNAEGAPRPERPLWS